MFPPDPRVMREDEKPERIHWVSWLIVALGLAALVLFAVVPGVRVKLHDKAFEEIEQSDPSERVVDLMGRGDASAEALGGLERYWGDETNLGVRHEDVRSVLTWRVRVFTRQVTWQVGFDAGRRAISKHRFE